MASKWRAEVRDLVRSLPQKEFTLTDVHGEIDELSKRHPSNNTVKDTIRRLLQELRDEGEIEFLGRGKYRRLSTSERPTKENLPEDSSGTSRNSTEVGAPDSIPLENRSGKSSSVSAREASEAIQHEQCLVDAFKEYLTVQGHEVVRWRIPTRSDSNLYTDLYDVTTKTLYEAKGHSTRESVRLAIGQLFDYRRYLDAEFIAVLLPDKPNQDMIDLLHGLDIACTYKKESSFFDA